MVTVIIKTPSHVIHTWDKFYRCQAGSLTMGMEYAGKLGTTKGELLLIEHGLDIVRRQISTSRERVFATGADCIVWLVSFPKLRFEITSESHEALR